MNNNTIQKIKFIEIHLPTYPKFKNNEKIKRYNIQSFKYKDR